MGQVYNKRMVEGITVPAVIHNGGYYYIGMPVYEDGCVDCWSRIALDGLAGELERGWLVTEIAAGETISIHGLGAYKIVGAEWTHSAQSYLQYIYARVKAMNAEMVGLFVETSEQKERWKANKVRWSAKGTPYKLKGNFGYLMFTGDSTHAFYKVGEEWMLTSIAVFEDKTIQIDAVPEREFSLKEIEDFFAQGVLTSELVKVSGDRTVSFALTGLGHVVAEPVHEVGNDEKLKEILDLAKRVAGEKTAHEICRGKYYEYLVFPSDANRQALREAYEEVPEHERMYLGDMDTKDGDYRRILFHPEEKREV